MSIGMVLGGALQGIGAGITQKGQMDFESRRQTALENLRSANNQQEITMRGSEQRRTDVAKADLDDRNASRQVNRQTNSQIVVDNAKTGNTIKVEGVKFDNDKKMASFKAALDRANDAASQQLKAWINAGEVKEVVDGGDGMQWAIFNDGRRISTGIPVAPKGSGGSSILEMGGPPSVSTPRPAAQPQSTVSTLPPGWKVQELKK